jgi:hypothetical protein
MPNPTSNGFETCARKLKEGKFIRILAQHAVSQSIFMYTY